MLHSPHAPHTPHAIPVPPLSRARDVVSRAVRRTSRGVPPVIHDRWGDDTGAWTPTVAPLAVSLSLTTGGSVVANCAGYGSLAIHLIGRWRGVIRFETSDDGAAWRPLPLVAHATGERATGATGPGMWVATGGAGRYVRVWGEAIRGDAVRGCIAAAPPVAAHEHAGARAA